MTALDLVQLTPLMQQTSGRPDFKIGLLDGPVYLDHPDLATEHIRDLGGRLGPRCIQAGSVACMHGTFVAGVLLAKRGSQAPAICPGCTLLVRPIFSESAPATGPFPSASPEELAAAIIEGVDAGARVLNLSVALMHPAPRSQRALDEALHYATKRGVIVVAAAGNQALVGSSLLTRHPWVIPVVACDERGRPAPQSNLGHAIGRGGLRAPGVGILSLGTDGRPATSSGTSVAAPYVTGAAALLWSVFPDAKASDVRLALTHARGAPRRSVVPPLLDAWGAYQALHRSAPYRS
jgi:subtilisin family serine protease